MDRYRVSYLATPSEPLVDLMSFVPVSIGVLTDFAFSIANLFKMLIGWLTDPQFKDHFVQSLFGVIQNERLEIKFHRNPVHISGKNLEPQVIPCDA